jgi:chaperonin GroES
LAEAEKANKKADTKKLSKYSDPESLDITEFLDENELEGIGKRCQQEYQIDKDSRSDWEKLAEEGLALAKQDKEDKNFPWDNAANVKYPLITTAAIQFAARAYPEIVQGPDIVRVRVLGEDPGFVKAEKANRVSPHMSYQLLVEMEEWEEETDKLLHILPINGLCYRQTYFSSSRQQNISELCIADDVVVHDKASSLEHARRISRIKEVTPNEIHENQMMKIWREVAIPTGTNKDYMGEENPPEEFIQQHRTLDLDGDGYEEPYIVVFHKESGKVVRIRARYTMEDVNIQNDRVVNILPIQQFTKFSFLPNIEGRFHDMGFGTLMYPINEAVNTAINELLDSGSLYNAGGGFLAKGANLKGGPLRFSLGEWKTVDSQATDLRQAIMPLPIREPSQVLFMLLGSLIEAGKDISAVKDVMTGQKPGENVSATTVLALIEQGMKVFSAIYKRIYRSLTKEFEKLFRLNSIYLNEQQYFTFLDTEKRVSKNDYDLINLDVVPVADPNLSLDVQRIAKAEALMGISGRPGVNEQEITKRYVEAIKIPNPEQVLLPPDAPPPPNPEIELKRQELQFKQLELQLKQQEFQLEVQKADVAAVKRSREDLFGYGVE